jgi:hypothetical protein
LYCPKERVTMKVKTIAEASEQYNFHMFGLGLGISSN